MNNWLGISYRCKWCRDEGCVACPPLPKPVVTIKAESEAEMRAKLAMLKNALGAQALEERAARLGTGQKFNEETLAELLKAKLNIEGDENE